MEEDEEMDSYSPSAESDFDDDLAEYTFFDDGVHGTSEPDRDDVSDDSGTFDASDSEMLLFEPKGKMLGTVAIDCNDGGFEVGGDDLEESLQKHCTDSVACGRIFCKYISDDGKFSKLTVGSGFKISPTIILTASHVCQEEKVGKKGKSDEGVVYKRNQVYISFKVDTTQIKREKLDSVKETCRLKLLNIPRDFLLEEKFGYLDNGKFQDWNHQHDFSFLTLDDSDPRATKLSKVPFVYPLVVSPLPLDCLVIGYPGFIEKTDFKKKYSDANYDDVETTFSGFKKRTISFGQIGGYESRFIRHNAPTVKGSSGGAFVAFEENSPKSGYFMGLHVGGSGRVRQNFVISVKDIDFALSYFRAIIDTSEVQDMDKKKLIDYFKCHQGLPDEICKFFKMEK